jgi:nitrogen fixation protein FixH
VNPHPSASPGRRYRPWRDSMLLLIVGIFAVTIAVNVAMVWYAEADPPELVRADYYAASKDFDRDHEARLASARQGWQVSALEAPRSRDTLELRIADADGRPANGLAGKVSAYRASDEHLDQALAWSEDPAQPGLYRAVFLRPRQGLWRITLDVHSAGKRLYRDVSVVMP